MTGDGHPSKLQKWKWPSRIVIIFLIIVIIFLGVYCPNNVEVLLTAIISVGACVLAWILLELHFQENINVEDQQEKERIIILLRDPFCGLILKMLIKNQSIRVDEFLKLFDDSDHKRSALDAIGSLSEMDFIAFFDWAISPVNKEPNTSTIVFKIQLTNQFDVLWNKYKRDLQPYLAGTRLPSAKPAY